MKVGMVALHYPRREHRDEMISRVRQAADVMAATPGCLTVDCWVSEDGQVSRDTQDRSLSINEARLLFLTVESARSWSLRRRVDV